MNRCRVLLMTMQSAGDENVFGAAGAQNAAGDDLSGYSLALDGLPDTFADVERDYLSVTPSSQPESPSLAGGLVSGFVGAVMGVGGSGPCSWPEERRAATSWDNDIEDRLALVQDTLTDFEANVGAGLVATDCAVAESAAAVDRLAEELRTSRAAFAEELAGVRRAVHALASQVRALVEGLSFGPAAS